MSFRIGQRVKFVRASGAWSAPHIGKTGTVDAIGPLIAYAPQSDVAKLCEYRVAWDGGRSSCVDGWQLEPIQPEGWRVVGWSSCLWMPEHMRETA